MQRHDWNLIAVQPFKNTESAEMILNDFYLLPLFYLLNKYPMPFFVCALFNRKETFQRQKSVRANLLTLLLALSTLYINGFIVGGQSTLVWWQKQLGLTLGHHFRGRQVVSTFSFPRVLTVTQLRTEQVNEHQTGLQQYSLLVTLDHFHLWNLPSSYFSYSNLLLL